MWAKALSPALPLMSLINVDTVDMTIFVPQTELPRVQIGMPAKVYVDAYPAEVFNGEVASIAQQAQFSSRDTQNQEDRTNVVFPVKVRLPNADKRLKAGMTADAELVWAVSVETSQVLQDLRGFSLNLRGLQRSHAALRSSALFWLTSHHLEGSKNTQSPLISDLIFKGDVTRIKEIMAKSTRLGMQTFDQDLFNLFERGIISYEEAMRNADSKNELRLRKLESKRQRKSIETDDLALAEDENKDRGVIRM